MAVTVEGDLALGVSAKDVVLAIVGRLGTTGGVGHVVEYRGSTIRSLSMEGRMTVCNMSIEAGARAGMIAPDEVTFEYVQGRRHAPKSTDWDRAVDAWRGLATDVGARFDAEVDLDAAAIRPHVSGHKSCPGRADRRRGAEPRRPGDCSRARGGCPSARLHGS